jgi:hypothetical protein
MNIDTNAPNAITTPPILGMGSQWIFRSVGKSSKSTLQARLMKTGISKIVKIVEIRNVENKIIRKSLIYSELKRNNRPKAIAEVKEMFSAF